MKVSKIVSYLYRLSQHIEARRKRQFCGLLLLMIMASFAEVISIGAVIPFLGVLIAPEKVFTYELLNPIFLALDLGSGDQLILPITIFFVSSILVAGIVRLSLLWVSTRLSFAIGADISLKIYKTTLYQPYEFHCATNTSEIINSVFNKTNLVINNIILQVVLLVSNLIMLSLILSALIVVKPYIALSAFGGFGLIYLIIIFLSRRNLEKNSLRVTKGSTKLIKTLQEGLGGIRDVLLNNTQEFFSVLYRKADLSLRRAQGTNLLISSFPRYAIESLGMLLICLIAYWFVKQSENVDTVLPLLGALALGAQRLLPILQQAYVALTSILGSLAALKDIVKLLETPVSDTDLCNYKNDFNFNHSISLSKVSFRYSDSSPEIFSDINLKIKKGMMIGIVGSTGIGKSTILDIIMGLQKPYKGTLQVDGLPVGESNVIEWQRQIAHVPQNIYLADSSIAENIAFGIPKSKINIDLVKQVAKRAQISDSIECLPEKYETFVGERGVRLSGGQLQRIGIARALYKSASVIIFDEATSSLDNKTERSVMKAIESLKNNLTIIVVAHRLTTLKNCDMILELTKDGGITSGSYNKMLKKLS